MSVEMSRRSAVWATGGSILSAAAASACCWAPLLLIAFGASAAGVSAAFEQLRPWFLAAAGILLGFGFYLQYFRRPSCDAERGCASGSDCATGSGRTTTSSRIQRVTLWIGAAFVLAFAFFPSYAGDLLAGIVPGNPVDSASATVLPIEGMTCEACAYTIQESLREVVGVVGVEVSYDDAEARVMVSPDSPPEIGDLIAAVERAGYGVAAGESLP